ncbi:MAG: hypothetical protein ACFUZC_07265 [Chthoniobacteraceae bacterium]
MDITPADKLYVPVRFKETYEASELVTRIERAFPKKTKAQVHRYIFRVGLQQVSVQVIKPEGGK